MEELIASAVGTPERPPPALVQIRNILEEEANELARWIGPPRTEKLPHRVELAVRREMKRLRDLASDLDNFERKPHVSREDK
jgi:hypothetical protein